MQEMAEDNDSVYNQCVSQLHEAAAQGDGAAIIAALKVTPDINVTNSRGWTALMFAARNGRCDAVRMLVENGCDVTMINSIGQTAKDIAEFWLHEAVIAELSSTRKPTADDSPATNSKLPPRIGQAVSLLHQPHANYFCDSPLDRDSNHRTDEHWLAEASTDATTIYILFVRLELVVRKRTGAGLRPVRFTYLQMKPIIDVKKSSVTIFLGVDRNSPGENPVSWFAVDADISDEELSELCPEAEKVLVHPRLFSMPRSEAAIIGQARSVLAWHDRYRFCPTCGAPAEMKEAGYKRRCTRDDCRSNSGIHNTCYPRTDPTVIIAVVSPDKRNLLLGRGRHFPGAMYSCLAGFMEPGEGIEEACRREVHEESGVRVDRVDYHSCQPWPMPSSLMIGCIGQAATTDIKVDKTELEDARWFSAQDVRLMLTHQHPDGFFCPPAQAIAHQLIKHSLSVMSKL